MVKRLMHFKISSAVTWYKNVPLHVSHQSLPLYTVPPPRTIPEQYTSVILCPSWFISFSNILLWIFLNTFYCICCSYALPVSPLNCLHSSPVVYCNNYFFLSSHWSTSLRRKTAVMPHYKSLFEGFTCFVFNVCKYQSLKRWLTKFPTCIHFVCVIFS